MISITAMQYQTRVEVFTIRTLMIAPSDQTQASSRQIEARTSFLQFLDIIHFAKKTG